MLHSLALINNNITASTEFTTQENIILLTYIKINPNTCAISVDKINSAAR